MQFNKGGIMTVLRPWQKTALQKAIHWFLNVGKHRQFLMNAAPGAGKTLASISIANELIKKNEIDRVIIIAPRTEVVDQFAVDFKNYTGRFMSKVTKSDGDLSQLGTDICATWNALVGLKDAMQAVCQNSRVLVICDEHHHAAIDAAWGEGADKSFTDARFVLILTGTPVRSDNKQSIWLDTNNSGLINHPDDGTYTLTYGEAIDLGYCNPVTIHRHEGNFSVSIGTDVYQISSKNPAALAQHKKIPALQRALDFYKLVCTPQYQTDNITPNMSGYQATMIREAHAKLMDLRKRMSNAGGLIIAPTIDVANYMADLVSRIQGGKRPMVVHSQQPNSGQRIKAFRNNNHTWIVSVNMISEGVDIKRLRVLVYLPYAKTELAFRQAVGRIVRKYDDQDHTRGYVVMPSLNILEDYARRIEEEMPNSVGMTKPPSQKKTKTCPKCSHTCGILDKVCDTCGHEFKSVGNPRPEVFKTCDACGTLNPTSATSCNSCGKSFAPTIAMRLIDALRTGAIIRGMDLSETEVQVSEQMADKMRDSIFKSCDEKLKKVVALLPEESWSRLATIVAQAQQKKANKKNKGRNR